MIRHLIIILLAVSGYKTFSQNDTTHYIVGLTPQYIAVQALRLDFEIHRTYENLDIKSINMSPYIYYGDSYYFEGMVDQEQSLTFVKGVGLDLSYKFGTKNPVTGLAAYGEAGIGFHHVNYEYTDEVWTEEVIDGNTYIVIREKDVLETANRGDIFFIFNIRDNLFDLDAVSYNIFFGPIIKFAKITSNETPRDHEGIFQHGTEGVFIRLGVTIEGMILKN